MKIYWCCLRNRGRCRVMIMNKQHASKRYGNNELIPETMGFNIPRYESYWKRTCYTNHDSFGYCSHWIFLGWYKSQSQGLGVRHYTILIMLSSLYLASVNSKTFIAFHLCCLSVGYRLRRPHWKIVSDNYATQPAVARRSSDSKRMNIYVHDEAKNQVGTFCSPRPHSKHKGENNELSHLTTDKDFIYFWSSIGRRANNILAWLSL